MPLTNADYLASPEPSSPDLAGHFTSLGASPERARKLAKFVRTSRTRARLIKPAALIGVVFIAWIAYALSLAFSGSPSAPGFEQMVWPSMGALAVGIVIAISYAAGLTTGPFWESSDSVPRELASVPRRAIVQPIAIGRVFIGVGFAVIVSTAGLIVQDAREASWLRREGVETTGTVIDRNIRKQKSQLYTVIYRYSAGGVVMQNSANVRRVDYERMTVGSTVPVTYYASRPAVSKPYARADVGSPSRFLTPLLAIGGGIVVLAIFMIWLMSYAAKQQERVATRGVAALARVTKVRSSSAQYSYGTNQGVIDSRVAFGKQRPAPMPVEGETYIVLYDPDNPRRSIPLAMLQDVRFD